MYIADEVVFTKNGGNDRQPWKLMEWEDLVARYRVDSPFHPICFRCKVQPKRDDAVETADKRRWTQSGSEAWAFSSVLTRHRLVGELGCCILDKDCSGEAPSYAPEAGALPNSYCMVPAKGGSGDRNV
ncbi:MAG: hypothetical protein JWQ04_2294 [Pedosphaera sp.]|nr:hypothetical protein [Pedosphaera sp.]